MKTVYEKDCKKSIVLVKNRGFILNSPLRGGKNLSKHKKAKRGSIKGWSKSSRMRSRAFLINNTFPPHWVVFGLTLTIPAYPLTYPEAKRLFKHFQVYSKCLPYEMAYVWRMEVQKRKQLHFHLIVGADLAHTNVFKIQKEMLNLWIKCFKSLGMVEKRHTGSFKYPTEIKDQPKKEYYDYFKLVESELSGYWEDEAQTNWIEAPYKKYSVKTEFFPSNHYSHWLRYLINHTTKSKQYQIPNSAGKHWGYGGKKHFIPTNQKEIEITDKQYSAILRWQNRLQTPVLKDEREGALFGKTKAKGKAKRSSHGSKPYFGDPATAERMLNYALETIQDTSECMQVIPRYN